MSLFRAVYRYEHSGKIAGMTFSAASAALAGQWAEAMLPAGVELLVLIPVQERQGPAAEVAKRYPLFLAKGG